MKVKLDLVGLDGNAFSLMGAYKRAAREQGVPNKEIADVIAQCMGGDYKNLLRVLMENTTTEEDDEPEDEDDSGICPGCAGSGEGMYEGTRCHTCGGSGELNNSGPDRYDWLADRADALNDAAKDDALTGY